MAAKAADLAAIERFLFDEARLLDERRFEEWRDLFAEDGYYWAPTRVDQANPRDHASLFYDDKERMQTRINRLRHPRAHAQVPPSHTVHIVANVILEGAAEPGEIVAHSAFTMIEARANDQHHFAGRYEHRLTRADGGLRIARKKAILVNCDAMLPMLSIWF